MTDNLKLCISIKTSLVLLLHNSMQRHRITKNQKPSYSWGLWLRTRTCPFSSKPMQFLSALVVFWWKILRILPYNIPPPFCGSDCSFRTLYFQMHPLPTRLHPPPPPHTQIWGHLFTPQPGGWKRFLLPDSLLHPALSTTMPSPTFWDERALPWMDMLLYLYLLLMPWISSL